MKRITIILILILSNMFSISSCGQQNLKELKVGDKAPFFTAFDDNNRLWDIKEYIGEKNIVIFFFPAAMTGGCTKQACSYRDSYSDLENENAIVVGISGDEVENLKIFKTAYNLNFPLLSDNTGLIAKKFNVPLGPGSSITREINGKEIVLKRGVTARRWTFIVNKKGEIIYINQEVDATHDSDDVLKILKAEKQGNHRL